MTFLFLLLNIFPSNDTSYFEGIIKYEIKTSSISESGIKERSDTMTYYITKNRIKIITNKINKIRNQEIKYVIYDYLSEKRQTYIPSENLVLTAKMSESIVTRQIQQREDSIQVLDFVCKKMDIQSTVLHFQNHIQSESKFQTSIWVAKDLKFQLLNDRFDEFFNNTSGYIALYCESENKNHTESNVSGFKKNFHLKTTKRAIEIIPQKLSDAEFTFPPNTKFIGD